VETIKKWRIYAIFLKSNVVQFYMCVKYNGSSYFFLMEGGNIQIIFNKVPAAKKEKAEPPFPEALRRTSPSGLP
jgi:hypothetical protein